MNNLPGHDGQSATGLFIRRTALVSVGLVMLTLWVYGPVTRFGFVNYDDPYYVYENPRIRSGLTWPAVVWAFTTREQANWHPLTRLSHLLDYELFGLNAAGHHLVNLLWHAAATWLLFQVLYRMTAALGRSAWTAAVFALHPLHVESVAWIAERKDVLSACLGMLTLWAYTRYVQQRAGADARWRWFYASALLFFALGLMAKPMLVTLPFVLLLLDYWPLGRLRPATTQPARASDEQPTAHRDGPGRLVREKLPFLALAIGSCAMTLWAQAAAGAIESLERLPLPVRLANATVSYARYIAKTIWPVRLAVFYPYGTWPAWAVAGAAAALATVTVWVLRERRRRPQLAVGWFWYLGTLVPVIGLVQVGVQSAADRYMYVPMIGLLIMVAWAAPPGAAGHPAARAMLAAVAAVALGACAVLCRMQLGYWKDSETLFRHALTVAPGNAVAHNNLGAALKAAGKTQEAIREFQEALRLNPKDWRAQINLGTTLLERGRFEDAIRYLEQATAIEPRSAIAHNTLGVALLNAGREQAAALEFEKALELDPRSAQPHYNLGLVSRRAGKIPEAIAHFEEAVRLKPDFVEAKKELAGLRSNP